MSNLLPCALGAEREKESPPSDLLTLPPEIRLEIYSHLLLNEHVLDFFRDELNGSFHSLTMTCQQLRSEALDYYYKRNTFRIRLTIPQTLPSQDSEKSERLYQRISMKLGRVQRIQFDLMMRDVLRYETPQKKPLAWLCQALMRAKESKGKGWTPLNSVEVLTTDISMSLLHGTKLQIEIDEIVLMLRPLRGIVDHVVILNHDVDISRYKC